jgi:hypothetical protein
MKRMKIATEESVEAKRNRHQLVRMNLATSQILVSQVFSRQVESRSLLWIPWHYLR